MLILDLVKAVAVLLIFFLMMRRLAGLKPFQWRKPKQQKLKTLKSNDTLPLLELEITKRRGKPLTPLTAHDDEH